MEMNLIDQYVGELPQLKQYEFLRLNLHVKETYTLFSHPITPGVITKLIPIPIFQRVSHGTFTSLYHDPSVTLLVSPYLARTGWKGEKQIFSILLKFWQD